MFPVKPILKASPDYSAAVRNPLGRLSSGSPLGPTTIGYSAFGNRARPLLKSGMRRFPLLSMPDIKHRFPASLISV